MRTLVLLILTCLGSALAAPAPQREQTFEVGGRTAFLLAAAQPAPHRPWVWFAPTFKSGLGMSGARGWYYARWLDAGISIAGYDLGEVRGSPGSTAKFAEFHAAMVTRGFSAQLVLLGQSRGGIMLLCFAVTHPDKLTAFAGIYPVCNLASWPLTRSKAALLADFGLTETELLATLPRYNPVENLSRLAANKVPLFSVHGDSDLVVPLEANSTLLQQRYESHGGRMTLKVIPGEGHKVGPSFFECQELADFILQAALEPR